ncbi:MAG: hypothetical protein GY756_23350 [bacterium]|nr:hypothetical protein [bacterium]
MKSSAKIGILHFGTPLNCQSKNEGCQKSIEFQMGVMVCNYIRFSTNDRDTIQLISYY